MEAGMNLETWRVNILDVIQDIADKEKQEVSWPLGNDDISSPTEMYCLLFDDFMFEDFLASKENGFSDEQVSLGNRLVKALDKYSPPGQVLLSEQYMLEDPQWDAVRKVASTFLESMK